MRRSVDRSENKPFDLWRIITPKPSLLGQPSLAQSHEPFLLDGRLHTVYQVNERGLGFFGTTFREPGEIWLADLSAEPIRQWRIAPAGTAIVAEPEPVITKDHAWVFYSQSVNEDGNFADHGGRALPGLRKDARRLPRFALYRAELLVERSKE